MKLYTEEQVKQMIDMAHNGYDGYYDIMSPLTPIELPSDEEIHKQSCEFYPIKDSLNEMIVRDNWVYGAKWVIEQIKNKYL